MARKRIRVIPHGSSWQVKYGEQVLSVHGVKTQAVSKAREYAEANQPSQLIIHLLGGGVEYDWIFGTELDDKKT